jgi:sugar fermentation stimulation protein A
MGPNKTGAANYQIITRSATALMTMRFDPPLTRATLLKRYQRFLADVQLENGEMITLHCPNTGSMLNCNAPGSAVLFSDSGNLQRKYRYTLEAVGTLSGAWAGVNTARANVLVQEAIEQQHIESLRGYTSLRREVRYGAENSRVDFLLEGHPQQAPCYVEVKNVTLESSAREVLFPDTVTQRGSKHLRELMGMRAGGKRALLFFCVQHSSAVTFSPARDIDRVYSDTLREAVAAGVEVVAWGADISVQEIRLRRPIAIRLD